MSEELRRKLKEARAKLSLTQTQAAEQWGFSLKTLINWENNYRTPRGFALKQINEMLDRILAE